MGWLAATIGARRRAWAKAGIMAACGLQGPGIAKAESCTASAVRGRPPRPWIAPGGERERQVTTSLRRGGTPGRLARSAWRNPVVLAAMGLSVASGFAQFGLTVALSD